jgi:hypothetical protein
MMHTRQHQFGAAVIVVLALPMIFFTGCATTGGAPHYTQMLPPDTRIVASDTVQTEVSAAPNVPITQYEKTRLADQITGQIRSRAAQSARASRSYQIAVQVTRYDKGNAFARSMLAGLGQMHIDGTVSILAPPGNKIGEFTINKTFSWGGIYGASTTIKSIEAEFAKAVADAVTAKSRG